VLSDAGLLDVCAQRETLHAQEFARLQESTLRLTGDAALGLRLSGSGAAHHFDAVGHMLCHADTLRDALVLAARYGHMVIEDYHLKLQVRPDAARITFEFARCSPGADRMIADFVISGLLRLIQAYAGPQAQLTRVSFEYDEPKDAIRYRELFRCPVLFAQPGTALEFPRSYLAAVSASRDPEFVSLLRQHAEKDLAQLLPIEANAASVSRYLRACASRRVPTMSETARDLGLSTRSLRRRLAEEGVSFRGLVQAALLDSAIQMLSLARRPVDEVASTLGFTDVSSFQRAFKRWKGVTPSQYLASVAHCGNEYRPA
jgi:AraC-like DNA-binding protein